MLSLLKLLQKPSDKIYNYYMAQEYPAAATQLQERTAEIQNMVHVFKQLLIYGT